jgi:hypothetical protein
LEDIRSQLSQLPVADLQGLWAVGLVASTRKDNKANGRYLWGAKPVIHLYSYPATYSFKLPAHTKHSDIERGFAVELQYGMQVEQVGSRYVCRWQAQALRRFVMEHVLMHEIGHHVYHWRRYQQGLVFRPYTRESEQFAEAYALRRGMSGQV